MAAKRTDFANSDIQKSNVEVIEVSQQQKVVVATRTRTTFKGYGFRFLRETETLTSADEGKDCDEGE
jgi:hypothetical protein